MYGNCEICGAAKQPLFTSTYCPVCDSTGIKKATDDIIMAPSVYAVVSLWEQQELADGKPVLVWAWDENYCDVVYKHPSGYGLDKVRIDACMGKFYLKKTEGGLHGKSFYITHYQGAMKQIRLHPHGIVPQHSGLCGTYTVI